MRRAVWLTRSGRCRRPAARTTYGPLPVPACRPAAACELLWLRYGEDLEPAEIASVTRRTPVHVRVLLHRARAALAAALEHDGTGMRPQGGER